MADVDKQSKTEKPTGKRISEAKSKGNVPRSPDFTSSVMLIVGISSIYVMGGSIIATLKGSSSKWWGEIGTFGVSDANVYKLLLETMFVMGMVLLQIFLILLFAGIVINHLQEPIAISWDRISFSLDKLNPVNGLSRLFSKDSLVEGIKSAIKIFIISYISYKVLKDEAINLLYLTDGDLVSIMSYLSHLVFKLVLNCAGTLLLLSFLDLLYVKWRFVENLKMTKEEVKEESKQTEGDPKIKGKIRQAQIASARRRMRVIIPTADVIITNPTHYAVALKYDRGKMSAPVVILKGADYMAQQIKELAREFRITIVENRPLARSLFDEVDENHEIPEKMYAAVAEVLAYVYGLKNKL